MAGWSAVIGVNWLWGASSARTKAAESPLILLDFHAEITQRLGVRDASVSQDFQDTESSILRGSKCRFGRWVDGCGWQNRSSCCTLESDQMILRGFSAVHVAWTDPQSSVPV